MGWSFGWESKEKLVEHLKVDSGSRLIASKVVGKEFWQVREYQPESGKTEKIIVLYLLEKSGGDWGYKGMSEACGPYYYRCPASFLNEVPEVNPEWRAQWKTYHETRNQKISVGQVLKLSNGKSYTVTSKVGAKVYACGEDGVVYRIPKSMLTLQSATVEAVAA